MALGGIIAAAVGVVTIVGLPNWLASIFGSETQNDRRDAEIFGDVVELPTEAKRRTAKELPGGKAVNAARAQNAQGMSLTHSDRGL